MNERIRELLLQATTLRGPPFIRFKVDQEKFAELIVRECAEVGSFGHGPTDSGLIKRGVLEHFGFEE